MVDVMDYRGCVIAKFYDTELADEYIAFKMGKNKPVEIPEISDEEIKLACPQSLIQRISCWIQCARWYREELKKRLK